MCGIERNYAPSLLHQALQRPSTFEQTGLDLELVHSAGSRPWDRGREGTWGAGLQKEFFWPFGPHFGLKIRWGGGGGATGPFRWIRHWFVFSLHQPLHVSQFLESITSTLFSCWFISLKKEKYSYPLLTIFKEVTFKSRTKNQRNNHNRNACLPRDSEWTMLPTLSRRPWREGLRHRMGDNPPGISCLETNYLFLGKIQPISWLPDKTDYLLRHLKYLLG